MSTSNAVLFIDNGGYNIKSFYLSSEDAVPRFFVIPNCVGASTHTGRGITGQHIHQLPHYHSFMVRRPVEKGFIVDGLLQAYLWEHILQNFRIDDESTVDLWLTIPFAPPRSLINLLHILLTKRFAFKSVTFMSTSFLSLVAYSLGEKSDTTDRKRSRQSMESGEERNTVMSGTGLMVDVGFSSTTVVPYVDYLPVYSSIVRIDVGGKLLTNRLKQHISYTQMSVMEDGWLMNYVKETCCEVPLSPSGLLQDYSRSDYKDEVRYYLPTTSALMPLGCREEELVARLKPSASTGGDSALQVIRLQQERYFIPELLFCPSDVGLDQMGVSEALSVGVFRRGLLQHLPLLRPFFLSHVCVYGGTGRMKHFRERLEKDLSTEPSGGLIEPKEPTALLKDIPTEPLNSCHLLELIPLYGALAVLRGAQGATHRAKMEERGRANLMGNKSDLERLTAALARML
ncbi:hypothetical protein AGDE_08862 [Angomonas deanei]|nr:hypothetical protein AGDE_08862 [Angomonas deanei]|eukprot:EPY32107.1 hypothetical protein AGDE_08862 [Angomonas deanei]